MPTALIVDDHDAIRELYRCYLEDESFTVSTAGDGKAAIQQCVKDRPDIVLLDVMLPDITGLDVLRYLCQNGIELRVIVMSGHLDTAIREEAKRLGAQTCLEKPFTVEQLKAALGQVALAAQRCGTLPSNHSGEQR